MAIDLDAFSRAAYYRAGGGKPRIGIGDVLKSFGTAAQGVGQGLSTAVSPQLEMLKQKRAFAQALLEKAISHGETPISWNQAMNIFNTGEPTADIMLGGGKTTPGKSKVMVYYNRDNGKFEYLPEDMRGQYEKDQFLDINPPNPSAGGSETAAERKRKENIARVIAAAKAGTFYDRYRDGGTEIPIDNKKNFDILLNYYGVDANEPEVMELRQALPDEAPGVMEKIAAFGGRTLNTFKNAMAPTAKPAKAPEKKATKTAPKKKDSLGILGK